MHITRKQALVALVAGVVPWLGRRAYAQVPGPVAEASVRVPTEAAPSTQLQLEDLKKRVAALEAQLAQQVAFTKDDHGNLTLKAAGSVTLSAPGSVTLNAVANLTLEGKAAIAVRAAGVVTVKGNQINLN
jgi:hypothetical protein